MTAPSEAPGRRVAVLLAVVLGAGCVDASAGPPPPPEAPAALAPLPEGEGRTAPGGAPPLLRFENVTWTPERPMRGDGLTIRADVVASDPRGQYVCSAVVTEDGMRGGGLMFGGTLDRAADGSYGCRVPAGHRGDLVFFFLHGHDGEKWVRSAYFFVDTERDFDDERPRSTIASFTLEPNDDGRSVDALVMLENPLLDTPLLPSTAVVHSWLLTPDGGFVSGAGTRLESVQMGRFEGVIEHRVPSDEGTNWEWLGGPHFVLVAFAHTVSSFDGFDRTDVLEVRFGDCVTTTCLTS